MRGVSCNHSQTKCRRESSRASRKVEFAAKFLQKIASRNADIPGPHIDNRLSQSFDRRRSIVLARADSPKGRASLWESAMFRRLQAARRRTRGKLSSHLDCAVTIGDPLTTHS